MGVKLDQIELSESGVRVRLTPGVLFPAQIATRETKQDEWHEESLSLSEVKRLHTFLTKAINQMEGK